MSVQIFDEGDELPTVGVEHEVFTTEASGVYVFQVNRRNMQPGDVLEVRVKAKTREEGDGANADTVRYGTYADAPVDDDAANLPVIETEPFSAPFGCSGTIEQAGTAVVFPWVVKRVG